MTNGITNQIQPPLTDEEDRLRTLGRVKDTDIGATRTITPPAEEPVPATGTEPTGFQTTPISEARERLFPPTEEGATPGPEIIQEREVPTTIQITPPEDITKVEEAPPVPAASEPIAAAPAPVEEEFNLVDPLTGEVSTFDSKEKFDKARVKQASTLEQQKIEDEIKGKTDDILIDSLAVLGDVIDPDTPDPIAEAQFNWQIQKLGPTFQAQTAATTLKLKQAGIDPNAPGAGMAIMTHLARQQNTTVANIVGSLNVQSANRMVELSKWGVQNATRIQQERLNLQRDTTNFAVERLNLLANVIKSDNPDDYQGVLTDLGLEGVNIDNFMRDIRSNNILDNISAGRSIMSDYEAISNFVEGYAPGVIVDQGEYAGLFGQEGAIEDVNTRLSRVRSLVQANDIPGARAELQELQKLYPDVFPGDYSNWDPADFDTLGDFTKNKGFQGALLEMVSLAGTNEATLFDAVDFATENLIDPETVDAKFDRLWGTLNEDQRDRLLSLSGLEDEPLTTEERARVLGADQVRGLQDTGNNVKRFIDTYLQTASDDFKVWYQEPDNADAFQKYVTDLMLGNIATIDDETGLLKVDNRALLDPTNPDSKIAHLFLDWPYALDADGNYQESSADWQYTGNQPRADGNFEAIDSQYQESLDNKWESYVLRGGKRTRSQWFEDSQGGSVDVPLETREEAKVTPVERAEEIEAARGRVTDALKTGQTPETADIIAGYDALTPFDLSKHDTSEAVEELIRDSERSANGWINLEGTAVQITGNTAKRFNRQFVQIYDPVNDVYYWYAGTGDVWRKVDNKDMKPDDPGSSTERPPWLEG